MESFTTISSIDGGKRVLLPPGPPGESTPWSSSDAAKLDAICGGKVAVVGGLTNLYGPREARRERSPTTDA